MIRLFSKSVAVFIDAANLWEAQKAKGYMFDFQKLKAHLEKEYAPKQVRIFYYTAYPAEGTRSYSTDGRHKFYTYLKKGLGFTVRKKELKRIAIGSAFEEKGNMDVEITLDAMHQKDSYDTAIFFSGDSDFLALVTYLRNGGKKVFVYSSKNNISHELKTGGDGYTDILNIKDDIWGKPLVRRSS
jgi:uncharacterized LabA/DUF88 family protein